MANQSQNAAVTQRDRARTAEDAEGSSWPRGCGFRVPWRGSRRVDQFVRQLSSTDSFCGTTCHSMTWAATTYKRSPHFDNRVGVRATCGDCHIPYDSKHPTPMQYIGLLLFKADRGVKDVWGELTKRIRTEEEWDKRRPQLAATVETFLNTHDSITCRGCHTLEAFSGPRNAMTQLVHRGVITADTVECLSVMPVSVMSTKARNVEWRMVHLATGRKRSPGLCAGLLHVPWRWAAWRWGARARR